MFKSRLILLLFLIALILLVETSLAVTNILQDGFCPGAGSKCQWAWNDDRGWLDFYSTNTVEVISTKVKGYAVFEDTASDNILLDCATTPGGDICSTSNFKVIRASNGDLSGWAWNDGVGWISFCGGGGADANCPGAVVYKGKVDSVTGDWSGWAWNDVIGWIDFNCANDHDPVAAGVQAICAADAGHDFKVDTSWVPGSAAIGSLVSSIFDTGFLSGVSINSVIWRGDLNGTGNAVKFQIASSDCTGGSDPNACDSTDTWTFLGPGGTSLDTDVYNPLVEGQPEPIVTSHHNNKRYYRYKIFLDKAQGNPSPVVRDVIINWSP